MQKISSLLLLLLITFSFVSCTYFKADVLFSVDSICSEHSFGEWKILLSSTSVSEGIKQRSCTKCGFSETEKTPKESSSIDAYESEVKIFEVVFPAKPQDFVSDDTAKESLEPIKIEVNESEKTIVIEGASFPPSTNIDYVKSEISQILKDNNIHITPDFDYNVKIPGYEDNKDLIPMPY